MNRTNIINALIKKISAKSYLEIGVYESHNFDKIECQIKVGVDPEYRGEKIMTMTSDEFFEKNTQMFDVILVDGLHLADQVERDINNSLKFLSPNGYIVCHDMNPLTEEAQNVPYQGGAWNGDCWKAWMKFRTSVNGLEMYVIDTDHGCGIIRRNPTWLFKPFLGPFNWERFNQKRREWLNLISVNDFISAILELKIDRQSMLLRFIDDPKNPENNWSLALHYDDIGQTAAAISFYIRTAERSNDVTLQYESLVRAAMCFARQGTRGLSVRGLLNRAITLLPKRPEAFYLLARWYERENLVESWVNCYTMASLGQVTCDFKSPPLRTNVDYPGDYAILFEKAVSSWWVGLCEESKGLFIELATKYKLDETHRNVVASNLKFMKHPILT